MYGNKTNPYASVGVYQSDSPKAAEPERQREIDASAGNLEFWAGQVGQTLDRLYTRLQPVLGPASLCEPAAEDSGAGCELAGRINTVTARLTGYHNLLREIESRLEI